VTIRQAADVPRPAGTPGPAETVGAPGRERRRPSPHPVRELRAATVLLTRLPVRAPTDGRSGSAAFSAVGAALGLLAGIPALVFGGAAPLLAAMLALAVLEVASGTLHLDGLADTADALAAPDAVRAEAARKDPRVGSAGVAAIVLVLGSAAGALAAIPPWAAIVALIVAGAASRAVPALAAPLLARPATGATEPAGFGAWFARRAGPGGALAALLTVALVAAGAGAALAASGRLAYPGAVLVPGAGAIAGLMAGLLCAAGLRRRFGMLAGDFHGASVEVALVVVLAVEALALSVAA
jgi:adenosylcobinamide-GDP ribazoletransferase